MTSYYNENDKNCCDVLRRQIQAGNLPDGFVDDRSIEEVQPNDIKQYNEAHFFAGIGGFALGFARAAIPANVTIYTGGFPCQDLSIAGERAGLAGKRSGLYFEFHRLITANYPEWVVLENVPGLLSSNEGKDFAIVIGGLTGIVPDVPAEGWGNAGLFRGPVYNVAYRVLDAQFFGVPQRRRRVFIVGSLGSGSAAEVLFESEGLPGDTPPSREAGKEVAYSLRADPSRSGDKGDGGINTTLISAHETGAGFWTEGLPGLRGQPGGMPENLVARSQTSSNQRNDLETENFIAFQQNSRDEVRLMGGEGQYAGALAAEAGMKQQNYIINLANSGANQNNVKQADISDTVGTWATQAVARVAPTLEAEYFKKRYSNQQFFSQNGDGFPVMPFGVRRLTPTECARLQGFPDDWNDWLSDTVRYRQFGNAVAVPVVEWIGKRIIKASE